MNDLDRYVIYGDLEKTAATGDVWQRFGFHGRAQSAAERVAFTQAANVAKLEDRLSQETQWLTQQRAAAERLGRRGSPEIAARQARISGLERQLASAYKVAEGAQAQVGKVQGVAALRKPQVWGHLAETPASAAPKSLWGRLGSGLWKHKLPLLGAAGLIGGGLLLHKKLKESEPSQEEQFMLPQSGGVI